MADAEWSIFENYPSAVYAAISDMGAGDVKSVFDEENGEWLVVNVQDVLSLPDAGKVAKTDVPDSFYEALKGKLTEQKKIDELNKFLDEQYKTVRIEK